MCVCVCVCVCVCLCVCLWTTTHPASAQLPFLCFHSKHLLRVCVCLCVRLCVFVCVCVCACVCMCVCVRNRGFEHISAEVDLKMMAMPIEWRSQASCTTSLPFQLAK